MLKLFRQIRQQLVKENKLKSYSLYAIGEILLVVIGILIALQINNWNEDRKERIVEIDITTELYNELNHNLKYTESEIQDVELRIGALEELFTLTTSKNPIITYKKFNTLYARGSSFQSYTPIINKVNKILELDKFKFSKSKILYDELLKYFSSLERVREYYQLNVDTWKMANQPFLIEHYPLRNFYWIPEHLKNSKHTIEHKKLLNDRKFESLLASMYADVDGYHKRLLDNIEKIQSLKKIIEKDYAEILPTNQKTTFKRK